MFSISQFLCRRDRFQELLEEAVCESHKCVQFAVELTKFPHHVQAFENLRGARLNEKKISAQISHDLARAFITGMEREDIEGLARSLFRIPKAAEKLAERLVMAGKNLEGIDFSKQADMMAKASAAVQEMVRRFRHIDDSAGMKVFDDRLQAVETEADKHMTELLRDLYNGKYDPLRAMILRDLYELMEKVVDRCHDAGNVVKYIALKNS